MASDAKKKSQPNNKKFKLNKINFHACDDKEKKKKSHIETKQTNQKITRKIWQKLKFADPKI